MTNTTPTYRSRVRGALLGGAIGDALGNPIEFLYSTAAINAAHGPNGLTTMIDNRITDDTQMTLFTAEGLIRAHRGGQAVLNVHDSYLRWLDTQGYTRIPPTTLPHHNGWLREQSWLYARRAPGATCISGLQHRAPLRAPQIGTVGPLNPDSKGCGTVMRSAPFGLNRGDLNPFTLAAECSYLTHGHPTAALSAGAFALIVACLTAGIDLRTAVEEGALKSLSNFPNHRETSNALWFALDLAKEGSPNSEKVESLGAGWVAEEALSIAVYCALVEADARQALILAVNHAGDSDSTGAICGNLLGAWKGEEALPADWAVQVEGREAILQVAEDFIAPDAAGVAARYPL